MKEGYEFYGDKMELFEQATDILIHTVNELGEKAKEKYGRDIIEHVKSRIKSPESMKDKLKRKGLAITAESALSCVHDAVGIRIICGFADDVYTIADMISGISSFETVKVKDFIKNPKPNGYRSYHMIVKLPELGVFAEIQIRTIAMDSWASLEHELKYKREIPQQKMISAELKRCADEMASTDLTMQTIRDLLYGGTSIISA